MMINVHEIDRISGNSIEDHKRIDMNSLNALQIVSLEVANFWII